MNIEEIYQNADITSVSKSGEFNQVLISYDEYDFLTQKAGVDNQYKGHGDDFVEMDYHSDFVPLINKARNNQVT